ncbi:MAG: FkbM family methyltransferase [Accumulibacter sp.]|uniref:FkbM family methyltransferase n=1 Tax=Accumulibacter sp. TaxID=2053492 RepID=UPI003314D85A
MAQLQAPNHHSLDAAFAALMANGLDGEEAFSSSLKQLACEFLSAKNDGLKFLLGRNEHSATLMQYIVVDGIVDDFSHGKLWNGKPVIKCDDIPKDAMVVNCSMSISPITAGYRLQQLGLNRCISYADLCKVRPDLIPVPTFVSEMRQDFSQNEAHWLALLAKLADKQSRTVFNDLVRYRLTANPAYMENYSIRLSEQYFEDFLALSNEVFVDAGGFNGDTTEEFCKRYPDYKKVILFEPSGINMQDAQERLANCRDINFIAHGISDAPGTLWFDPNAGSASAVSPEGSCSVEVTTLDISVSDKVSFIKMDLEGWELKALAGAKKHIFEDHPKLAIAVYHRASDFWRIPEYILSTRQDYDIYLRHYTEGWSETVMFFLPK